MKDEQIIEEIKQLLNKPPSDEYSRYLWKLLEPGDVKNLSQALLPLIKRLAVECVEVDVGKLAILLNEDETSSIVSETAMKKAEEIVSVFPLRIKKSNPNQVEGGIR